MKDKVNPWLDYWEQLPEGRLLFAPESDEYVKNFLREFRPKSTDRVLDYGCGFGQIALRIAPYVGSIVVWDEAENMRTIAARNLANCTNARLWNGEDGHFDYILVNSVVQYLSAEELQSKLIDWSGRLSENGRIVLSDLSEPDHSTIGDLTSLLLFSLRRGYCLRAFRNTLAERSRYAKAARSRPMFRPTKLQIEQIAAAAGFTTCYLSRNLTHFRSRKTAVLTR